MKIVVIGGTGLIGSKTVAILRQGGHEVVAASPKGGVNTVTGEGLKEAIAGAQVVIDLSNAPSRDTKAVWLCCIGEQGKGDNGEMPRRRTARNSLFSGRRFADEVVTLCVRGYLRFKLSYRDVAEIAWEMGIFVAPSTIMRWVIRYAEEFALRWRPFERPVGGSWRADETYIKIRGNWMYLYRAVDGKGKTVESYLSRTRDVAAAKAFFRKALKHHGEPRSITLDGFEPSHAALRRMGMRNEFNFRWANPVKIRSCKYLNNIVEQDHRRIKFRTVPMLGFKSFYNARRVLIGIELMHKIVKGQFRFPVHFGYTFDSIWQMVLAS